MSNDKRQDVEEVEIIDTEEVDGKFVPKDVITITKSPVRGPRVVRRRQAPHGAVPIMEFVDGFATCLGLMNSLVKKVTK